MAGQAPSLAGRCGASLKWEDRKKQVSSCILSGIAHGMGELLIVTTRLEATIAERDRP